MTGVAIPTTLAEATDIRWLNRVLGSVYDTEIDSVEVTEVVKGVASKVRIGVRFSSDVAEQEERALTEHYRDAVLQHGGQPADSYTAWDGYFQALPYGFSCGRSRCRLRSRSFTKTSNAWARRSREIMSMSVMACCNQSFQTL